MPNKSVDSKNLFLMIHVNAKNNMGYARVLG